MESKLGKAVKKLLRFKQIASPYCTPRMETLPKRELNKLKQKIDSKEVIQ